MDQINHTPDPCCPLRAEAADRLSGILNAEFFRALCEPVRLQLIVQLVRMGASDVTGLAAAMPQDRSVISRHLQVLERTGIVSSQQDGRHVIYRLEATQTVVHFEAIVAQMREMISLSQRSETT